MKMSSFSRYRMMKYSERQFKRNFLKFTNCKAIEIIENIVRHSKIWKTKRDGYDALVKAKSVFEIDIDMSKYREEVEKEHNKMNEYMTELAKMAGWKFGRTSGYWYDFTDGNISIGFVDQDNRFCYYYIKDKGTPKNIVCIYDDELENALLMLHNFCKKLKEGDECG